MRKAITTILLIILISLVVLTVIQRTVGLDVIFGKKTAPKVAGPRPQNTVNVSAVKVEAGDFIRSIVINGELEKKTSEKSVVTDTAGIVVGIKFNRGDYVNKGDIVAYVDQSKPGASYKPRSIVSPVSGYVIKQDLYEGQSVSNGAALMTVGNPGELLLAMDVPEKYLSNVGVGSEAWFTTAAWPDERYDARVSFVDSKVSTSTRTVRMELSVINPDSRLLEGMFVRCSLVTDHLRNVIAVPDSAVSTYLGNNVVYVVSDGKAVRRSVKTGLSDNGMTVIEEGLSEGELVVSAGSVSDGSSVRVVD